MPFSKENIVVTFEGYEVSVNTFVEFKSLKFVLFCFCVLQKHSSKSLPICQRVSCTQPLLIELSEVYSACVRAHCCIHLPQPI